MTYAFHSMKTLRMDLFGCYIPFGTPRALADKDATLRQYAAQSLHMITSKDFGNDYDKWMKWYSASKNK
jgi:hypothetical protein